MHDLGRWKWSWEVEMEDRRWEAGLGQWDVGNSSWAQIRSERRLDVRCIGYKMENPSTCVLLDTPHP